MNEQHDGSRAPSRAFQQAIDEVARIWEAADHLDTKILQFVAIVSAGFLTAGGISVRTWTDFASAPEGWCAGAAGALLVLGLVAYVVFFGLLVTAVIGTRFGGPLDPRRLASHPEYLSDDARFERDMLQHVATAFETSRRGLDDKIRKFRHGIVALGLSFACFTVAVALIVCSSNQEGSSPMVECENPSPTPSEGQPNQPGGDSPTPAPSPGLGPYEVERGIPPATPRTANTDTVTKDKW